MNILVPLIQVKLKLKIDLIKKFENTKLNVISVFECPWVKTVRIGFRFIF
jgi:hypothetical protein